MLVVSMGKVKMDKVITVMWILGASAWAQTPDISSTTQKPSCFRGWTGPDSGGSCSFTTGTFCDWRVVQSDDRLWTLTGDNEAKLDPGWWSDFERGRLRSPPMCEQAGRQVCVQIKFRFNSGGGSRLYASVCGHGTSCTRLFRYVYKENTDWIVKTVQFVTPGIFEIFIVGEKYEDTFGGESAIFIDYIRYNSTSCGNEESRVSSLSTMDSTWAESSTGPTTSEMTGAGTEQGTTGITGTTGTTGILGGASTAGVVESGHDSSGAEGVKKTGKVEGDGEETAISSTVVVVIVCAGVLLLLVVSTLLAIFVCRRRHSKAPHTVTGPQTRTERNESIVTFTNELYTSVGQCTDTGPQQDVTEGSARHTTPRPVTSAGGNSQNSDVYYTSMDRPASSPAKVATKVSSPKQTDLGMTRLDEVTSAATTEEVVYDSADIAEDEKKEDEAIYENTDDNSAEDKIYENTAPRDSEPAAASSGADDTNHKMEEPTGEYSHLIKPKDRPDRRRDNYDHVTESN